MYKCWNGEVLRGEYVKWMSEKNRREREEPYREHCSYRINTGPDCVELHKCQKVLPIINDMELHLTEENNRQWE